MPTAARADRRRFLTGFFAVAGGAAAAALAAARTSARAPAPRAAAREMDRPIAPEAPEIVAPPPGMHHANTAPRRVPAVRALSAR